MLLALDVGNTNTVVGVYQGRLLKAHWRTETNPRRTADEYGVLLTQLLAHVGLSASGITSVVVSSVVPPMMLSVQKMTERYFGCAPMFVGPGIKTGMPILYDNPREVGADRVVNAVAGFEKHGGPLVVVDFGTATTFDVVSAAGDYVGGAICPGITVAMEALFRSAAKLPRVEFVRPPHVVGKNTTHSIQSGLVFGYVGLVDGICQRIKVDLGEDTTVVATGGLAGLIAEESAQIDEVDEFLTLDGLRLIYERNLP